MGTSDTTTWSDVKTKVEAIEQELAQVARNISSGAESATTTGLDRAFNLLSETREMAQSIYQESRRPVGSTG